MISCKKTGISLEFDFRGCLKDRKEKLNNKIICENEETVKTLCLFKVFACFLNTENAKINLKIFT